MVGYFARFNSMKSHPLWKKCCFSTQFFVIYEKKNIDASGFFFFAFAVNVITSANFQLLNYNETECWIIKGLWIS